MVTDQVLQRLNIVDIIDLIETETKVKLKEIPHLDFCQRLWYTGLYDDAKMLHEVLKFYKGLFK